jgi:hypothetical protein
MTDWSKTALFVVLMYMYIVSSNTFINEKNKPSVFCLGFLSLCCVRLKNVKTNAKFGCGKSFKDMF